MWGTVAKEILAAACSSGVEVERAIVAAGPDFARDCRMLAVHVDRIETVPPLPRGPRGAPLGMCAWLPKATFVVTFSDDCVPGMDDDGAPPGPEEITAHAVCFHEDAARIYDAVSAWVADHACCEDIILLDSLPSGPGNNVTRQFPVVVTVNDVTDWQQATA